MQLTWQQLLHKSNQHWEMAGLARQDGDTKDELRHTKLARDYQKQAKELKDANRNTRKRRST
jgi:hypothetical protein